MRDFGEQDFVKLLGNAAVIILGNLIYAAGVVFFILPSDLITGGMDIPPLVLTKASSVEGRGFSLKKNYNREA